MAAESADMESGEATPVPLMLSPSHREVSVRTPPPRTEKPIDVPLGTP
jgi:hypothetical protein